ncbi:MAG TPA: HDOD domain-containing protein [Tepidisphaeraceae bacterium]|jgi:HD-like signal output (HDOD) protein
MTFIMTAVASDSRMLIQQAIGKVSNLPTLPEITTRIIDLVHDPRSTAAQLHHLVSNDPALASRILKTANSAFYGIPGQIGSMERAIVMLGLNAVKNIAVAASIGELFRGATLCKGFNARDLWKHCIAVGVGARELAKQVNAPIAGEAFLAGLIHDIGILVWLQAKPAEFSKVCEQAKDSAGEFTQIEWQILGADHQMVGMAIAEQWRFPRPCQLAAGYHHQPTALAEEHRLLPTLVYVADTISCQAGHGFNLTALHQQLQQGEIERFGITPTLIKQVTQAMPELITTAEGLL